jgi:hypothetical protein
MAILGDLSSNEANVLFSDGLAALSVRLALVRNPPNLDWHRRISKLTKQRLGLWPPELQRDI